MTKLPNEDTITQFVEVDVVVLASRDNKSILLEVFIFNHLDGVNDSSVSDNEVFFDEEFFSFLFVEVNFTDVKHLHLARSVSYDDSVVVLGDRNCC